MNESPMAAAEALLSDYFDTYGAGGEGRLSRVAKHPMSAIRAWQAIALLPVLSATLGSSCEADVVRRGLRRANGLTRASLRGTTAVLPIPSDGNEYLSGPGESNRSLRTKVRRAERQGFTLSTPVSRVERQELLDLCSAYERAHPDARYRTELPNLDHLLDTRTWLVASDATGRPLLVAVVPVDGEWAVLQHFRTLENSNTARLARPWLSVQLVHHLSSLGVRYLADTSSPVALPSGLRSFQRQLGYRLHRVRIDYVLRPPVGHTVRTISRPNVAVVALPRGARDAEGQPLAKAVPARQSVGASS